MNILITAVGAMASDCTIACLRQSLGARVFGVDTHDGALLPAAGLLDGFQTVSPARHPDYIPRLLETCRRFEISCLLPLTDPEVDVLTTRLNDLPDTLTCCVPSPDLVAVARNKRRLAKFAESLHRALPIETHDADDDLPAGCIERICKPVDGRSSEGMLRYARGRLDASRMQEGSDYIFQPFIDGQVVTVDVVRDGKGGMATLARSELVRTPRGAGLVVDVAVSPAEDAAIEVGERLDLVGGINIEFLCTERDVHLMDINPRLSAGVEFSYLAGYDFPTNTVAAFTGGRVAQRGPISTGRYAKRYVGMRMEGLLTTDLGTKDTEVRQSPP